MSQPERVSEFGVPSAQADVSENTSSRSERPPVRVVPVPRHLLRSVVDGSPKIAAYGALAIAASDLVARCEKATSRLRQAQQAGTLQDFATWDSLGELLGGAPLATLPSVRTAQSVLQADNMLQAVKEIDEGLESARSSIAAARGVGDRDSAQEAARLWDLLNDVLRHIHNVTRQSTQLFEMAVQRLAVFAEQAETSLTHDPETAGRPDEAENRGSDTRQPGRAAHATGAEVQNPPGRFSPAPRPVPERSVFIKG